MFRIFDITLSIIGILLTLPILLLIFITNSFNTPPSLFYQKRVGINQKPFTLIKFRTMKADTLSVATHLVDTATITSFGRFLRRTKLDELPQLWNVLKGDMSLVGPRPCLLNQKELIHERSTHNVFKVRPGITGLAQIQNIDMSTPEKLAITDAKMIATLTPYKYFSYIIQTISGKGSGDKTHKINIE